MNGQDLKFLANRADSVRGRPEVRLAEVHARIRSVRRRRAAQAVAATSAAVLALVVGIAVLSNPGKDLDKGPIPPADSGTPTPEAARALLYSGAREITGPPYLVDDTFHFGDRVIETRDWRVHLDVTDDGFVYTTADARLRFSDGVSSRQIGSGVCGRQWAGPPEGIGTAEQDAVLTGNAGSLVAWFECSPAAEVTHAPGTAPRGTLVVFDTSSGREVVRQPMAACARDEVVPPCGLTAVVGAHVYITQAPWGEVGPMVVFDVTSGRQGPVTRQALADDIRSQPRGLVVGDTWQTGTATDGIGQVFGVTGARLRPRLGLPESDDQVATSAFDTATGDALALRIPDGYESDGDFTLFEWLDDDTVALVGGANGNYNAGDILTCRLSDGRCVVAAESRPGEDRLVPEQWLPG